MNRVVLDEALKSKLPGLESEALLCDEHGRTLGYFVPATLHEQRLYAWARSQVTDDELDEARRQPGGRTLTEILADLATK